jgi:hypothetical protein
VFIMPIDRRSRAVLAATLLLMGCQAAPPSLRPIKALRPEIETAAPRPGALRMMVRQQAITPAMATRFGLLDVQQLDWDTVRAWLSNQREGFEPRRLKGTAVVDTSTNERTSSLLFDDLTPGEGYTMLVRLYRGGEQSRFDTYDGSEGVHSAPEMIASGTSAVFPIRSGANSVNVSLTLSTGGRFEVDVDEPATTVNQSLDATFTITTESHYNYAVMDSGSAGGVLPSYGDIDGANGVNTADTFVQVTSIAREQDATGAIYFSTSGRRHQIFRVENGVITLIAGTGTVTAGDYNNAGDYAGALDARLSSPRGIVRAMDDDHIIFCDTNNSRIRILRPGQGQDLNGSPYRIETLIGGGNTALSTAGQTATDALTLDLASPTALVADDDGTLYFTDDENSQIKVYRYNGTGSGGDTTLIAVFDSGDGVNTSRASNAFHGALAIDRKHNLLWVGYEDELRLLSSIDTLNVAVKSNAASDVASWGTLLTGHSIKALAFDQTSAQVTSGGDRWGTLFFTADTTASGDIVYRVPVASNGLIPTYRVPEPIAGGGVTGLTGSNRARSLASMALGWGGLLVDLFESDGTSTDTRILAGRSVQSSDSATGVIYIFNQTEGLVSTDSLPAN